MPGSSNGEPFYCEECVPRGCTCNVYALKEFPDDIPEDNVIFWDKDMENCTNIRTDNSFYYETLDETGKRYPCCEYWYDEDGWDDD